MKKNELVFVIQRNVTILILVGICVMMLWSSTNHYFGSFQGGIAWVESARSSIFEAIKRDNHSNRILLEALLSAEHPKVTSKQQLIYVKKEVDQEWRIDHQLGDSFDGKTEIFKSFLDQFDTLTHDQSFLESYIRLEDQIFQVSIVCLDQKGGILLTLVDYEWLAYLEDIIATELVLDSKKGGQILSTFKCIERCQPMLDSKLSVQVTEDNTEPFDPPFYHEIVLQSPYQGIYKQFHVNDFSFKAFVARLPIKDYTQEEIGSIWIIVPEDVMLYWPKIGILGIIMLGFSLILILVNRLKKMTKALINPITEMISEVNQLRGEINDREEVQDSTNEKRVLNEVEELQSTLRLLRKQIKENENLSDQLRQSQKLEAVGTLAGGVAHDFNNLICVILMNCEVIHEDLKLVFASQLEEQANYVLPKATLEVWAEQMNEMLISCDQTKVLTQQLLSLSRDRRQNKIDFNVQKSCHEMSKLFRRIISEEVSFELQFAEKYFYIQGNKNAFQQALMNLVLNGRDALDGSGRIIITMSAHEQSHQTMTSTGPLYPGNYVLISVRDTGNGITDENQALLFEPFFSSKGKKGTGLGLTIVYNTIVKGMRGVIQVNSKLGEGSEFQLFIPTVKGSESSPQISIPKVTTPLRLYSVVLIEDNDQVRNTLALALDRYGFDVSKFASAAEFLQWLEKHNLPIDMVVSDVVMPNMSGPELWSNLQQTHPEIPFLFLTGYAEDTVNRYQIPEELILNKPIAPKMLKEKLLMILNQR